MEGVHEVHDAQLTTLASGGMELPYIEYGQAEPVVKLVWNGEDYWYHKTLPLKGYGAVMARHIREQAARQLIRPWPLRVSRDSTRLPCIGAISLKE